ncbi:hypothetical protein JKF63_01020 [Porcisia hertigi]|uniref:Uncharacterized protein n=1 Tax=Porcisia hertigi TaxID=2761500 RepID=A0A836L090_9TRYP|nr:hypothetical protein JKF63_01020 [Porcisia hertigi]
MNVGITATNYAAKCGELEGLLKRYCDNKKRQTKSFEQKLKEEVVTNAQLRKYIALLEAKLEAESESNKRLGRLLDDTKNAANATLIERERHLDALSAELESRLRMVELREQECAQLAVNLQERAQQYRADVSSYQTRKVLSEPSLVKCKKTMLAKLQHRHDEEDSVTELIDVHGSDKLVMMGKCGLDTKTSSTETFLFFERDELAARACLLANEQDERVGLVCSFLRICETDLKRRFIKSEEYDARLRRAEDLLRLQEVDLAVRKRKQIDLQRESSARVEMQRIEFVLQCRNVLRTASDLLESLPGVNAEAVMEELESRIQNVLQLPRTYLNSEYHGREESR